MVVRFDANTLDGRDARLIAGALPYFEAFARRYARLRVAGLEHVPRAPCLFVANHNGGIFGPDLLCTLSTLWSTLGPEAPLYALAHDFAMRQLTPLGRVLRAFGALRATPENAHRVLRAGGQVLVYPGGDIEAYRPYAQRDEIVLGRRRGFLRVARATGVPIVPLVAQGAHASACILTDGAAFAERVRLKRWARVERFPVALALPWGVALGPWIPYLPLPRPVQLSILPPLTLAPDEPLESAYERVRTVMQNELTALARRAR